MPRTAEAAKVFNQQLRLTAEAVGGTIESDHEYAFVCECGCRETAMLTLTEYDRHGGGWLEDIRTRPIDAQLERRRFVRTVPRRLDFVRFQVGEDQPPDKNRSRMKLSSGRQQRGLVTAGF